MFFLVLLLGSCSTHDETRFQIKSLCKGEVCYIKLESLKVTYQQDLITDQLLYSKPYPEDQVKSNIMWTVDDATLINGNELKSIGLPDCLSHTCTLSSNPTAFKFQTHNKTTTIEVDGSIVINGKSYEIHAAKMIRLEGTVATV
ncbi:DUF3281 family protein [Francisella sp. SYW-9]|uniref:DUF3281 family protein n=1 Tax=Francisella sp. SYW-9 TaxID=2610888 RepID=UPI00168CCFE1|nr:DUF3281 family protein [Francisella sp. SYW-9]